MKIITARILDATHLELSQPISLPPGKMVSISIAEGEEENHLWREAAKAHFLKAYADEDAIYDKL